jgi:hypothetical protein
MTPTVVTPPVFVDDRVHTPTEPIDMRALLLAQELRRA